MSSAAPHGPARAESAQPVARQNQITLASQGVPGPAARYVSSDDRLYIRAHNSLAGVVLTVRARLQGEAGQSAPQQWTLTPTSDRTDNIRAFQLGEGYLLSVAVFASSGAPVRGQTFVEVGLIRAGAAATDIIDPLLADYVVAGQALGWPGAQQRQSVEGPGALRSIAGTNPAAGAEVSESVPTNARWRLRSLRVQLVTDATVITRRVHVVLDDGATILLDLAAADSQLTALTRNYNAAPCGFQRAAQDSEIYVPLPADVVLPQGSRVRTLTTNLQAGDNFGAPQLLVEEWIED